MSHGTLAVSGSFGPVVADGLAALLAIAMGIQNAVARKLAVPDMTTTVLTMLLTGRGGGLPGRDQGAGTGSTGRRCPTCGRRLLVVATMLAGGIGAAVARPQREPAVRPHPGDGAAGAGRIGAALAASRPGDWRLAPAARRSSASHPSAPGQGVRAR